MKETTKYIIEFDLHEGRLAYLVDMIDLFSIDACAMVVFLFVR